MVAATRRLGASSVVPGSGPGPEREPMTEREAWAILLTVSGLGPAGFGALLQVHGGGRAILDAARAPRAVSSFAATLETVEGRGPMAHATGQGIVDLARSTARQLRVLRESNVRILTLDDPTYPARLRAIELPPPVLFVRGDVRALAADRAVAIVGTRRPTERGRLVAARIAAAIADLGVVVVSGLAVGIDGAAHAAAVGDNRPTIAVLGSGHRHLYPRAHARLTERILATGGAVISEMWPDTKPAAGTFPRRNRLISGLSSATIVVEAGIQSGALITADLALKQGREAFFVPGPIDEPRSAGCLQWLRTYPGAARIVAGIPELIEDLGLLHHEPTEPGLVRRPSLEAELVEVGATAREVARALLGTQGTLDELVASTGHPPATVLSAITLLELRGLVTTTYGRYRAAGRLASASAPDRRRRSSAATDRGERPAPPASAVARLPHGNGPC